MWKYLTVMAIMLLILQGTVYGAEPTAADIYSQLYPLQRGANIKVAYDMLGSPHETMNAPPVLLWRLAPKRVLIIFLYGNSIIRDSAYIETYEQIEFARQRRKELKEGFEKILGAANEIECVYLWSVKNFYFTLDYAEESDCFDVIMSFNAAP